MKKSILILSITAAIVVNCQKSVNITPVLVPLSEKARVQFISYVTNEKKELLRAMEYFDRNYIYTDTVGTRKIHYYIEQGQLHGFYTDRQGSLFLQIKVDIASYALNAGFTYQNPILYTFWKPIFKRNDGIGTSWIVQTDTQFVALDPNGKQHTLKFQFSAKARFVGWENVRVPADKSKLFKALKVHWEKFEYSLFDMTNSEMVWLQKGDAADYFEPKFGLLRSIADYTISKKNEPDVFRKSTWELYLMILPEN